MRKHEETFHVNKCCKLTIVFFIPFRCFQNRNLGSNFQTYLHENEALHTPTFYMKMITLTLSFI